MHRLFVFGTLRHPALRETLLGRPVRAQSAELRGHRVAPLRGRVYPALVPDPDSVAEGDIIEVTATELAVLDAYEGEQYTRILVRPRVGGELVEADVYLLTGEGTMALVDEGVWSLDHFVAHYATAWVAGSTPGAHHPQRLTDRSP